MAKGDKKKMQNQVNTQVGNAQNRLNTTYNDYLAPAAADFKANYDKAVPMQMDDYRSIMDAYKTYTSGLPANNRITAERVSYDRTPEMQKALTGYGNFADTGGYSDQDLTNMRSRAIAPVQSVYQNMTNELARQKNLQGGYAPNMAAAMTRMRSGTSQQMSDVLQQVNGEIAKMVQEGKLAGLSGLGNLSTADTNFMQQAKLANQSSALEAARANQAFGAYDPRLQALQGMASLYSAQPGMAKLFGDQMLAGNGQLLDSQAYQNQIGQMGIQGQNMVSQTPSNFETALGRVGKIAQMGANFAAPFLGAPKTGLPGIGGSSPVSYNPIQQAYNPIGQISFPRNSISFGG